MLISFPACRQCTPCREFPPYLVGGGAMNPAGGMAQQGYGAGATGGQGALPYGWSSGVDQQSGQTYYYHEQTGQSQWDPPR
jgi:hypothetical protein